jgi:voltage-gated potassium channel
MPLYKKIKNKVFEIFYSEKDKTSWIYYIDDYFITSLIVLNIIMIVLESFAPLYHKYYIYFHIFDIFSVIVFTIEYILRIWVADMSYPAKTKLRSRFKYIFSPFGITDLLAILPFYLPFAMEFDMRMLRILRLMRLFRVFKLAHYSSSMRLVVTVLKEKKEELFITVFASFILLLMSASIMFHIEEAVQPDKFPNIFASLWWAVATLTTIGYGDVYPITPAGQILAAITALFGIGLVAIPTGIISMGFMEELSKEKAKKKEDETEEFKYCPHCGKKLRD